MGIRRRARELALKTLFESDFNKASVSSVADRMLTGSDEPQGFAEFFNNLIAAFCDNQEQIDAVIVQHSNNWKLSRMASVDRNILRLGACEILFLSDVPKNVTINEYLEIAKKYGTEDSSSFVNGILDKVQKP